MKIKNPFLLLITLFVLVSLSCGFPQAAAPTPTPTGVAAPTIAIGGGGGVDLGSGSAGGGGNGAGGAGAGSAGSGVTNPVSSPVPSPNVTPDVSTSPYTVKQTKTFGGETISGVVCKLTQPFTVSVISPKVPFVFNFVPASANQGAWTYAYNIASAGETHDAKGSYTIGEPAVDGTLQLSMRGSDHVVFKGFDGNIPVSYGFNLVPTEIPDCTVNP